jgi:hypothetical protein
MDQAGLQDFNPERVGLVTTAVAIIVVVVRGALRKDWVPGVYLKEKGAECDALRAELKESNALVRQLADTVQSAHDAIRTEQQEKHQLLTLLSLSGRGFPLSGPSGVGP